MPAKDDRTDRKYGKREERQTPRRRRGDALAFAVRLQLDVDIDRDGADGHWYVLGDVAGLGYANRVGVVGNDHEGPATER